MGEDSGDETIPSARRDAPAGPTGPSAGRRGEPTEIAVPLDGAEDRTVPVLPTAEPPVPAPAPGERLVIGVAQGRTLAEVAAEEPLTPREVVRVGADVATLLAHLHERGHAHGAVTATNIVLAPGGRAQLVHVVGSGARAVTQTGVGLNRSADDVHDLGAALVRALGGADGGDIPEGTPRTLRRVLAAAAETDPELRPTARQMADTLAWAGRDEPTARVESGGSARWVFVGAGALIVLLALLGYAALRADTAPTVGPPTGAAPTTAAPAPTQPTTAAPQTPSAGATPSASPAPTPAPGPPGLPTALPSLPALPTSLPTSLPDLPDVPDEAEGLWDRFLEWLASLF